MKKKSALVQRPITEGSQDHTITVTIGGPAVEGYSREQFLGDLKKVSRKRTA